LRNAWTSFKDEGTLRGHVVFHRPLDVRDVDDQSGRADQTDGQKTENLSDFTGPLRSGDRGSVDESGSGSVGADSNLFHQGAAKESVDPDIVAATMAKPGVVLRRPVGSAGSFGEHAELPTDLGGPGPTKATRKSKGRTAKQPSSRPVDKAAERKAALAFEKEQKRRERERRAKRPPSRRTVNAVNRQSTRRRLH
jgi:hypothetical protein